MNKKTSICLKSVLTLSLFVLSCGAYAAETAGDSTSIMDANGRSSGYLGAMFGANIPSGNFGSDNSANFGLELGAKLAEALGIGFYGTYYGQGNSGTVFGLRTGTSLSTFNLAGELNAFVSIFHFGGDLGASISSWSANVAGLGASSSNTAMIYGPEAGFDIPLGTNKSHVSLGGEAHYLFTNAANGQNNLQILSALKVWL